MKVLISYAFHKDNDVRSTIEDWDAVNERNIRKLEAKWDYEISVIAITKLDN